MLRSWLANQSAEAAPRLRRRRLIRPCRRSAHRSCIPRLRRFEQPVLADRARRQIRARSRPSSSPGCGRRATASSPARSRPRGRRCPGRAGRARSSPRPPWRRHPCRASARTGSALSAHRSAIWPAPPSAGCRPRDCRAAIDARRADVQAARPARAAIARSCAGFSQSREMRSRMLIEMFL